MKILFFGGGLVHFLSISWQLVYPKLAKVRACPQPSTWHPSQWQFPVRLQSLAEQLKNNTAAAEVMLGISQSMEVMENSRIKDKY